MSTDDSRLWNDDDGTPDAPLAALLDAGLAPDVFRRLSAAGVATVRDSWRVRVLELRGLATADDRRAVNAAINERTWRSLGRPDGTPGRMVVVERHDGSVESDPDLSPETLAALLAAPLPVPDVKPEAFLEAARREREATAVSTATRSATRRKTTRYGSATLFD